MKLLPIPAALFAFALVAALPIASFAAPAACAQTVQPEQRQRLILTDGSYQIVTKYEVHGDRVRFFSAERDDWEDVPYSLIDWPATKKWNDAHQPGAPPPGSPAPVDRPAPHFGNPPPDQSQNPGDSGLSEAAKIDAEAAAERADLRSRTPLVAPGLRLPERDGVFVLDNFQNIPELIHIDQSLGNINRDPGHNVLRAAIASMHGAQEPVRINGQAARVRLHVDQPVLYVSLDSSSDAIQPEAALVVDTHGASSVQDKNQYSSPDSHYAIVRVDVHPGERVIGAIRISRVGGVTQNEDIIPTTSEILPGRHWMKLTTKEPLSVGEYALMEILGPGVVNLDVWDFGVSPNAPENIHPITPIHDGNE